MDSTPIKLVGYRRVSTKMQGESGLGLEAQDKAIADYVHMSGGVLIASYLEVETGTKRSLKNRPELSYALSHAKMARARLVIAKLDRLSRNVNFLSGLMESKVDFVCCDNPHATPLTIHILAAVAEDEAKRISIRVSEALGRYKAGRRVSARTLARYPDGVPPEVVEATAGKLGAALPQCKNLTPEARAAGQAAGGRRSKELADESYGHIIGAVRAWRAGGLTLDRIAGLLNEAGHQTRRQRPWNRVQVMRILNRFRV